MAKLSKGEVEKIAKLSKLNLTEKELAEFSKDLESILEAFKDLQKVPTKGVKPSTHPLGQKNVTREDKVEPSLSQKEALANAKQKEGGYFKGPKVV